MLVQYHSIILVFNSHMLDAHYPDRIQEPRVPQAVDLRTLRHESHASAWGYSASATNLSDEMNTGKEMLPVNFNPQR